MKILLPYLGLLAIVAVIGSVLIAGCKSSPQRQAFNVESTAEITVDAAMSAWGDYVRQFHPPASQEATVKALYEKYQAAASAVIDVTEFASNLNPTEAAAQRQSAEAQAAQALADIVAALQKFGVKLTP